MRDSATQSAYTSARERYAEAGVDTDAALARLRTVALSLPCWQLDDVGGFERTGATLAGSGLTVTGHRPGRPRSLDELRADLDRVVALLPGRHRLNLHAIYGDFGGRHVDRNAVSPAHFASWMDWAGERGIRLDFNATCFSHPLAEAGLTLSHDDPAVRRFWTEHCRRCRAIAAGFGVRQRGFSIHNLWIPDGTKEGPVDRHARRDLLRSVLDEVYADTYDAAALKDSVESKLFGIGSESFVVGSHEFYLGYALTTGRMLCLDLGHFHPTESVADKISALLLFVPELLLHLSRGVRWDSDHIVVANDEVRAVADEIVRADALGRVHLALDFFDGSVNRIGALALGARSTLRTFLAALLEPRDRLLALQRDGDTLSVLAIQEEMKRMPAGAVWDYHCLTSGVEVGEAWIAAARSYEWEIVRRRTT